MTVTISRAYGAAATAIARKAAEALGYHVLDEELPVVIDVPRSFPEKVMRSLAGGVPEIAAPGAAPEDDVDAMRLQIEERVHAAAAVGNTIVVGRMGAAILAGRTDLLRVYVHAPLAWRIAHLGEVLGYDARRAESEIARVDDARREYARERYRVQWGDLRSYDLVLDTSRFGIDGAAAILVAAVRAAGG